MSIAPLQLAFYKGTGGKHGALQFNLQRPHYYCTSCKKKDWDSFLSPKTCKACNTDDSMKSREGALFMEITSTTGPNVYDWEKKITMALSLSDLGKVLLTLEGLTEETKIMHDPGAKSSAAGQVQKSLSVTSPKGIKVGCMVSAAITQGGNTTRHTVPLSADEVRTLSVCIRHLIPAGLGW